MIKGLYTATSGMLAQTVRLNAITNNLANANTTGYKRSIIRFQALEEPPRTRGDLYLAPPNTRGVSSSRVPEYSFQLASTQIGQLSTPIAAIRYSIDFSEGQIRRTDNPLDIALHGSGFLVVQTPNGIRYTRSGNLSLNSQAELVTQDGFPVLGRSGLIDIQGKDIKISQLGEVLVDGKKIDSLRLADFPRPYALAKEGKGLYRLSDPSVREEEAIEARVEQGYIESSNVNILRQMVEMIDTMRSYEAYQKVIHLFDETIQEANNEVGRI